MADQPLTSVLWFRVKPGMNEEFEHAFADCEMLERPRVIASDGAPPDALARLAQTIEKTTNGALLRPC